MQGGGVFHGDERQVDVGLHHARKVYLGFFRRFLDTLHRRRVLGKIHALFGLEFGNHPIHYLLVEVVAAEHGVAVGGENFENAVLDLEYGNVEGAAAQVVDEDFLPLVFALVKPVGERRGGRLVDYPHHFKPGYLARVLGRLPLAVGEIGGDGYDRLCHLFSQIALRVRLELGKYHRAYLLGRIALAVYVHLVSLTHMTLDRAYRSFGIRHRLSLCGAAHQPFAVLGKSHHRRGGASAFRVGDDRRLTAFEHRHAGVCRTEVYTYYLCHIFYLLKNFLYLPTTTMGCLSTLSSQR